MPPFLHQLYRDHERIRRMLEGLVQLLEDCSQRGDTPDATVDFGMARWMEYLDDVHHRREEHLYSQLRRIAPEAARQTESLSWQHNELERHMHGLVRLFSQPAEPAGDATQSPQQRARACRAMVDHYLDHLRWEENEFFPRARALLQASDWKRIEDDWEREMAEAPWKQVARNVAMESFEERMQQQSHSQGLR